MQDQAEDPRVTRARLSGSEQVTTHATVAELAANGTLTVLVKGVTPIRETRRVALYQLGLTG
jgi:hypothetical protein